MGKRPKNCVMSAEDFKEWQKSKRITNPVMAKWLGVSPATIDNYRRGVYPVPLPVSRLAHFEREIHRLEVRILELEDQLPAANDDLFA